MSAFDLKLAIEVEKNGMGGFVFCGLPDIDATTSAGRMVLTMMASVADFDARQISECTKEALASAMARGLCLGGIREGAAQKAYERKQKAIAEAEGLRGALEQMCCAGLSCRAMADALAGVDKISSTEKPLAQAQIGRILQGFGLLRKLLGSDQSWVAA